MKAHKRVVFNGNGYGNEWIEEAERRGLPNISCMLEAIPAIKSEKAVKLFEKHGVLTRIECESRADILYEEYAKQINIEAKTMEDMALKQIRPAVMKYSNELSKTVINLMEAGADPSTARGVLNELVDKTDEFDRALKNLTVLLNKNGEISDMAEKAASCRKEIVPAMEALRAPADELEKMVDEKYWPFPTYGDLLFYI